MNPYGVRALIVPMVLVAFLASALGFFVARSVAGSANDRTAQVAVVAIPSTPTPAPTPEPTAAPSSGSGSRGRTSRSGRSCPAGCECQFPPGGTIIVCQGSSSLKLP